MLSREEISGENDEAAHSKRGVDADQYSRGAPFEEMCGKERGAGHRRQRNQRSGNYAEGSGALIKPPRRPAQGENEAAEAGDGAKPMQRCERPRCRRSALRPQMQNRERRAQQKGGGKDDKSGDQQDFCFKRSSQSHHRFMISIFSSRNPSSAYEPMRLSFSGSSSP